MKKGVVNFCILVLLTAIFLPVSAFGTQGKSAVPALSLVAVGGKTVEFDVYDIDGENYFKLRDLAFCLSGTNRQFEVEWDGANNTVLLSSGRPYTKAGGEMTPKVMETEDALPTSSKIILDGDEVFFPAYVIEGNNYFRLSDVMQYIACKSKFISDDEFVFLGGVRLGMTYEEAMAVIGDYDHYSEDAPDEKSVIKGGYQLVFSVVDESYGYYDHGDYVEFLPELERNGDYYLLFIYKLYGQDGTIRGIKIGDSVESVFAKFPFFDLGGTGDRSLYGEIGLGKPRAFLENNPELDYYRIGLTTTTQIFEITFNRENKVERITFAREDG